MSFRSLLCAFVALFLSACLDPTQVTFVITSDLPCGSVGGTAITVGLEGETEKSPPVKVTEACSTEGKVSAIGTYVVQPKPGTSASASFKVVLSGRQGLDVNTCTPANGYEGCIVARRRVTFVPHHTLTVPVRLVSICLGVQCDQNTSCVGGTCQSAQVVAESCDKTNDCTAGPPNMGTLACFPGSGDELMCGGETSWCTRAPSQVRACAEIPLAGPGESYQCRNAHDCGPNLACIGGTAGVLAQCAVVVPSNAVRMCTPDDERGSCGNGVCRADAGHGFMSCVPAPSDAGPGEIDAGIPWNLPTSPQVPFTQAQTFFKPSNADAGQQFGTFVALSGDGTTMVVGAPGETSASTGVNGPQADGQQFWAGAAYVFRRTGSTWTQEAYLKPWNTAPGIYFGSAVSISWDGVTIAVGAPVEHNTGVGVNMPMGTNGTDTGAVYTFVRTATGWVPDSYFKPSYIANNKYFGDTVALSGDGLTLGVGCPQENNRIGTAYVFRKTETGWVPFGEVRPKQATGGFYYFTGSTGGNGLSFSYHGDVMAAGSYGDNYGHAGINSGPDAGVPNLTKSGAAWVFLRSDAGWQEEVYIKASNAGVQDEFAQVAISGLGDTLAVGARLESSNAAGINGDQFNDALSQSGAVYLFERSNGTWRQTDYLKASAPIAAGNFGGNLSLAADGKALVVSGNGAAYVFSRVGQVWSELEILRPANARPGSKYSNCVSISGDGTTIAVGAPDENSNSAGINGDMTTATLPRSGATYVFHR